ASVTSGRLGRRGGPLVAPTGGGTATAGGPHAALRPRVHRTPRGPLSPALERRTSSSGPAPAGMEEAAGGPARTRLRRRVHDPHAHGDARLLRALRPLQRRLPVRLRVLGAHHPAPAPTSRAQHRLHAPAPGGGRPSVPLPGSNARTAAGGTGLEVSAVPGGSGPG